GAELLGPAVLDRGGRGCHRDRGQDGWRWRRCRGDHRKIPRLPLREEPAEDEARAGDLAASPDNTVVQWIRGRPRVVPPTARGRRRGGATTEVEVGGAGLTDDELARIEAAEGCRRGSCLRPDHRQSRCPASVVEDGGAAAADRRRDRAVED